MPNTKTSKRYLKCSSAFIHPLKLFEQVVPALHFAVTRLGQYRTRKSKEKYKVCIRKSMHVYLHLSNKEVEQKLSFQLRT